MRIICIFVYQPSWGLPEREIGAGIDIANSMKDAKGDESYKVGGVSENSFSQLIFLFD